MELKILPPQSFYDSMWTNGLQPELIGFCQGLNWFFIIMFINILYGLKHTNQFKWYDNFIRESKLYNYRIWIVAVITALCFIGFRWADPAEKVDIAYIGSLVRSVFIAVIFSGIFVDIPGFAIKRLYDFLEPKDSKKKETDKE